MKFFAFDTLRQYWRDIATRGQPLRVLLVLGSLMAVCRLTDRQEAVIPLFLGVIASALAETDDSWRGRLRAQLVTLFCFAVTAFSVETLFGQPLLFVIAMALAAFGLTMLGAIDPRYKAIAYATLILGIYATLGADHAQAMAVPPPRWQEPRLLLTGASCFGLVSVVWCALFPAEPVKARMEALFRTLGDYVQCKASLFEPLRDLDFERKRLTLGRLNATVVSELNATKEAIFSRMGPRQPSRRMVRYRGLYLIAQDVHERASSSHEDYAALADTFFHSDLLYRCGRVLWLQGQACHQLAQSISRREPFVRDGQTTQALSELRSAIAHARAQTAPRDAGASTGASAQASADGLARRTALLRSIDALTRNLAQLDGQLTGAGDNAHPAARLGRTDMSLFDRSPQSWRDAFTRVRRQLTPRSPLFRHAVRLPVALTAGYVVMHATHAEQGYWILLTTLFVCQEGYGVTIARMGQRIAGTAAGVVAGWAFVVLFPQPLVQSSLAVAAGVLFFATRRTHYLVATAAMTLLVLLCFNQVIDSGTLIMPRLIDTAIGSVIAGLAVLLVLPHWQSRRIHELAAQALRSEAAYLRAVCAQYSTGASDSLAYRLARRNAHNADAALTTAVSEMFREPGFVRPRAGLALRFLVQTQTLLGYLSALGAHRAHMAVGPHCAALDAAAVQLALALEALAQGVERGAVESQDSVEAQQARRALWALGEVDGAPDDEAEATLRLVRTQLALIWLQLDALREHAQTWLAPPTGAAPPKDAALQST